MKITNLKLILLSAAIVVTGMMSCSKDDNPKPAVPPVTKTDSVQAAFSPQGDFTYFSFKDDAVVPATDSNSTK